MEDRENDMKHCLASFVSMGCKCDIQTCTQLLSGCRTYCFGVGVYIYMHTYTCVCSALVTVVSHPSPGQTAYLCQITIPHHTKLQEGRRMQATAFLCQSLYLSLSLSFLLFCFFSLCFSVFVLVHKLVSITIMSNGDEICYNILCWDS